MGRQKGDTLGLNARAREVERPETRQIVSVRWSVTDEQRDESANIILNVCVTVCVLALAAAQKHVPVFRHLRD